MFLNRRKSPSSVSVDVLEGMYDSSNTVLFHQVQFRLFSWKFSLVFVEISLASVCETHAPGGNPKLGYWYSLKFKQRSIYCEHRANKYQRNRGNPFFFDLHKANQIPNTKKMQVSKFWGSRLIGRWILLKVYYENKLSNIIDWTSSLSVSLSLWACMYINGEQNRR